jgi:xanthine dehydrogenase accessory factor
MFDRDALARAIAAHGPVARVGVASVQGSAPREVGASMLVWADIGQAGGQSGTIGGGALEFEAARSARALLAAGGGPKLQSVPLGPNLGQCCGGAVQLFTEIFAAVPDGGDVFARPVRAGEMPLSVSRLQAAARRGEAVAATLLQGWFVEPFAPAQSPVWIWGAGHVGRALAKVLAPLPSIAITWVDTSLARFPEGASLQDNLRILPAADMAQAAALAPKDAHHIILTFSHALDLALCDAVLRRRFASCGVIGSRTKWARFRSRLAALGHGPAEISRIQCPIGDPAFGKHPHAIAIGVAASMMTAMAAAPNLPKEARA